MMGASNEIYPRMLELTATQRQMVRIYQQWLWGTKSFFSKRFTSKNTGKTRFAVEGLIDKVLTQLCQTGLPMQVPRPRYRRHLNASYWADKLPEITRRHIAEHLFGGRYSLYYVGSSRRQSEYILACLDIDDKEEAGDAPLLAKYVKSTCPLMKGAYVEPSTHGWGCHVYFVVHHPNHRKWQVNQLLKYLAEFLSEMTSSYNCESIIDGIKGTYPIVREELDEELKHTGRLVCESQGILAKLPRPRNSDQLQALINCPVVRFEQLDSFLANYVAISCENTTPFDQNASSNNSACQASHPPNPISDHSEHQTSTWASAVSSSSTLSDLPSHSSSAQRNTSRKDRHNCALSSSPAPAYTLRSPMTGDRGKIAQMIESGSGYRRKVGALFRLEQELRRYPTFDEYECAYYLFKANRNARKAREQRRKELRKVYEKFRDAFDLLKCGQGFRKADYGFVRFTAEGIRHLRAGKRSCPVELVRVIVYLAEKPRINEDPLRNHTLGIRLVEAVTTVLAVGGGISKPYTQDKQISAARRVAEHFGWIQQIDEHFVGSRKVRGASRKYIVGRNHPRYEQFMALYEASIEASRDSVKRLKEMHYDRKQARKEIADWAATPGDGLGDLAQPQGREMTVGPVGSTPAE